VRFVIEGLSGRHDRDAFDCGEPALNTFLQHHARQNQSKRVSRTFVAVPVGEDRVVGFYTLSTGATGAERLSVSEEHRLPRYPVPVIVLARLAVDNSVQGNRLGESLLFDALARAVSTAENVGVYAVEVTAKNERARSFYRRFGFREYRDNPLQLYLPITTAQKLLEG
jgi:ribosomal protein S18 acetylase RimI-like enzyme